MVKVWCEGGIRNVTIPFLLIYNSFFTINCEMPPALQLVYFVGRFSYLSRTHFFKKKFWILIFLWALEVSEIFNFFACYKPRRTNYCLVGSLGMSQWEASITWLWCKKRSFQQLKLARCPFLMSRSIYGHIWPSGGLMRTIGEIMVKSAFTFSACKKIRIQYIFFLIPKMSPWKIRKSTKKNKNKLKG